MDKNLDLLFDNKEIAKQMVNNSNEDQKTKKALTFALEHEKFTRDVTKFCSEETENPSDEKTQVNKGVDIAFDNKEAVKDLINSNTEDKDKNEDIKIADILLEDKKLTKDAINFALDENKNPSDEKTQISKGLDIDFDNKKAVKNIIHKEIKDENLKKVGDIMMEDKKLTKDVINFVEDEGKELEKSINEFSNKENKETSDYFKFASNNKMQVNKALDTIFDNKKTIKKMINTSEEKNISLFLDHENLARDATDLALNKGEKISNEFKEFSQSSQGVNDYTRLIRNSENKIEDTLKIINRNPKELKHIIDICGESHEQKESLKGLVDLSTQFDPETSTSLIVGCANAVEFFNDIFTIF